ncbi:hypothetical protein RN001_012833 [Aquatica leii]|uniref:Tetraspanin n=1 Tax=Aquatica leii TaxID=1421715 RepID=A0AAN7P7Z8_9COLE|nr:hypothetical protein RN001_012833 [Aquatica leii]
MNQPMDIGMRCIKYMLFVSNFMFVMVGFLLISIGTTISTIYSDFELFMEAHHFKPAQLIVAIGIIIFLVSMFGCIGAIRESTFLVNLFGMFLSILLILEISAAIAAYVMRSDISEGIEENMLEALDEYKTMYNAKESWDFMQDRLACCGVHQPYDWKDVKIENGTNTGFNGYKFNVPYSCCKYFECQNDEIYTHGCLDRLSNIVSESALLLGIGATCVALVQFLGVVFAFMLAKTIRRVKTDEEMRRQENRQRIYEQLALGHEEKVVVPVLYTPQSTEA